jgi:hypothetical protein
MRIGGVILLSVMLAYVFRPVYPYLSYVIHQEYIAEFLCVNKDKPELKCNGKCHLKEEIKNQSAEDKKPISPLRNLIQENILLWSSDNSIVPEIKSFNFYYSLYFKYISNYYFLSSYSFFHPPD